MYPYRRNVVAPIGVTFMEMKAIVSKQVGMYDLDDYIRWENFPKPKKFKKGQIPKHLLPALYLTPTIRNTKKDGSGQMRMTPRKLFGGSTKTQKTDGSDVEVRVIYLQPAKQSDRAMPAKGKAQYASDFDYLCKCVGIFPPVSPLGRKNPQTCPFAGECGKVCLVGSGQLGKTDPEFSGWCKTWLWFHYPLVFLRQLLKEIKKESNRSHNLGIEFYARLNGTSDITWERYIDMDRLVKDTVGFGGFYDYTKYPWKARQKAGKWPNGVQPKHYDLTYSISEKEEVTGKDGLKDAVDWLNHDGRVAVVVDQWSRHPFDRPPKSKKGDRGTKVVYDKTLGGAIEKNKYAITDYSDLRNGSINPPDYSPNTQKGKYPLVVDGDETDFRFNDPPSSIVILKPKGMDVREDGYYYRDGNVYTGWKPEKISGKTLGFIKSKDFVLALQNKILGMRGMQPSAAKNPRKRRRNSSLPDTSYGKKLQPLLCVGATSSAKQFSLLIQGLFPSIVETYINMAHPNSTEIDFFFQPNGKKSEQEANAFFDWCEEAFKSNRTHEIVVGYQESIKGEDDDFIAVHISCINRKRRGLLHHPDDDDIFGSPQNNPRPVLSKVTVKREKGFYYVVHNNRSMMVNGRQRFGTLAEVKKNLAAEGYKVVGKGNVKYVVPR